MIIQYAIQIIPTFNLYDNMNNFKCLSNINNKEILIEILNQSIDYLICEKDKVGTALNSHKCGFKNPEDFLTTCRFLAAMYQRMCSSSEKRIEENNTLEKMTPELRELIPAVLEIRRTEIMQFMLKLHNSMNNPLVEFFDWHTYIVKSNISFQKHRTLTAITLQSRIKTKDKLETVYFQVNLEMLRAFTDIIKRALSSS